MSTDDFYNLTPYEFSVLVHHHNKKLKDDYSILRNTIFNAGANLMRRKGEKEIPLFNDDGEVEDSVSKQEEMRKEREALFGKSE